MVEPVCCEARFDAPFVILNIAPSVGFAWMDGIEMERVFCRICTKRTRHDSPASSLVFLTPFNYVEKSWRDLRERKPIIARSAVSGLFGVYNSF